MVYIWINRMLHGRWEGRNRLLEVDRRTIIKGRIGYHLGANPVRDHCTLALHLHFASLLEVYVRRLLFQEHRSSVGTLNLSAIRVAFHPACGIDSVSEQSVTGIQ